MVALTLALALTLGGEPKAAFTPRPRPEAAAAPSSVPGYQRTRWGMSAAQVRALYPEAVAEAEALVAHARIADLPAELRFEFLGDRLARVAVTFSPRFDFNRMPAAPSVLLAAFDHVDGLLTQKYGPATHDRTSGLRDPVYVTDEEREAAVSRGELWLSHDWEFPETLINVSFAGTPAVYELVLTYASTAMLPDLEARDRDRARREADEKGL